MWTGQRVLKEQKLIQDTARDFAAAELEPVAAELDNGGDKEVFFSNLRKLGELGFMGLKIPTLFKQYADVCTSGGVRFCGFSIDPAFNHCVDGLVLVDIHQLKPKKRARYIGDDMTIAS